jgi:aminoglycoside phosphotransferase (APT) family kinase protein
MTHPDQELLDSLRRLGLIRPGESVALTPLDGGVSSDIWKVDADRRTFVVKRALPKLRVAADWHAPVERNRYEAEWIRTVASILPGTAPRLLASDVEAGLFAMEYCQPSQYPVWKSELLARRVDVQFATEVGRRLAAIHSGTAHDQKLEKCFATSDIFHAIRLEPYLEATAARHPTVSDRLLSLSRTILATRHALVHGDVSPKNILAGPGGPVFLDAECAWFGDPAFDLAFCLNHLLLKCLAAPTAAREFLTAFYGLAQAYAAGVDWERPSFLETRAARILPALFLARVDGKSPVEYVNTEEDRDAVRMTALPLIAEPPSSLHAVASAWAARLKL